MTPGPTPVPPQVLLAQGSPLVYHRGPGYGGLESSVSNLFSPGDRVVVPVAGYFGDRFARIAEAFGLDVRRVEYEWGRAARAEDIAEALGEAPTRGVLAQHSETSTGVIHDIEAIGKVAKDAGALFVVDVISSLGAVPYEGDKWGIDVAV